MPDSIFHKNMRQGITCSVSFCLFVFSYLFVVCFIYLFIFLQGDTSVFLKMKEMEFHCGVPLSLYGVLHLTMDVAFLFNTICLRVVANGF